MTRPTLEALFLRAIKLSRDPRNTWNLDKRMVKVANEVGELSEVVQIFQGDVNKKPKEPIAGEAADVMLEVLNVLGEAYGQRVPDLNIHPMDDGELLAFIEEQLDLKLSKWENILKGE